MRQIDFELLNPGDKIRVSEDLKEGSVFRVYVNDAMEKFAGKLVTVYSKSLTHTPIIRIAEDPQWIWSADMFVSYDAPQVNLSDYIM